VLDMTTESGAAGRGRGLQLLTCLQMRPAKGGCVCLCFVRIETLVIRKKDSRFCLMDDALEVI